jgi:GNAT superfamily N-acetyltransferase
VLLATASLARRLDRAEIDFCAKAARAGEPGGAACLEAGGGMALCGKPGAPFNKVLALGLGTEVTDADLDAIEEFYASRGVPAQVELCPLATPGLAPRLATRGFVLQGFENQLARPLTDQQPGEPIGIDVAPITTEQERLWLQVVATGFSVHDRLDQPATVQAAPATTPEPEPDAGSATIGHVTDVMRSFVHPGFVRLLAWCNGTPAAACAYYVEDRVVGITGTSTLPSHRRKGVQSALVAYCVSRRLDADLSMATVEPGSVSQRVFERAGFLVMYTRAVLVKQW